MRARDALQVAASALPQVAEQIRNDPEQADVSIDAVQEAAHVAAAATAGSHWTIAGWLPWIGDNTRAMQTITSAVDRIATEVLPQLPAVVHTVTPDRLAPKDGNSTSPAAGCATASWLPIAWSAKPSPTSRPFPETSSPSWRTTDRLKPNSPRPAN